MSIPLSSTDPSDLANAARCWSSCIPFGFHVALKTKILKDTAIIVTDPVCSTPQAPTIVHINTDNSTAQVIWKTALNHGSFVIGWIVSWGTVSGGPYPNNSGVIGLVPRTYTATGLDSGTQYFFTVTAVTNISGCTSTSPQATATTTGTPPNTLLTNLVHYYQLTEAPINYADSGSAPFALTALNGGSGVAQVAGQVQATATQTFNNGNSFDGISSVNPNLSFDCTGDGTGNRSMSYCCWFKLVAFASQTFKPAFGAPIFGMIGAIAANQSFILRQTAASQIQWLGTIQGGGGNGAVTTNGITDTNWHLFVGGFDFPNGQIWASFDGGARVNGAQATWNSFNSQPLIVMNWGVAGNETFGVVSDIGIWNNRILNASEIAFLWNGGAGRPFSTFH